MRFLYLLALSILPSILIAKSHKDKPVIGIFTTPSDFEEEFNRRDYSYVKHSYAEMIQEGGAEAVVIPWDLNEPDMMRLLMSVNGVLFTGGTAELAVIDKQTGERILGPYTLQAKKVIDYALKQNDEGEYFPILGICQGPQVITMVISEDPNLFYGFDHKGQNDYLIFGKEGRSSRLFSLYPEKLFEHLEQNKIMYFEHQFGIKPEVLLNHPKLKDFFDIASQSKDDNSEPLVAAIEGKNYPFYGVQYHPENTLQEHRNKGEIDRENDDFRSIYYIAKFFVDEARKSTHYYPMDDENMQRFRVENGERVYLTSKWYDVYFYRSGDLKPDQIDFYDFRLLRKFKLA